MAGREQQVPDARVQEPVRITPPEKDEDEGKADEETSNSPALPAIVMSNVLNVKATTAFVEGLKKALKELRSDSAKEVWLVRTAFV